MGGVNYWADPDRAVNTEGAGGGAVTPTTFGISVHPIPTRGPDNAQYITTCSSGFSDLPRALDRGNPSKLHFRLLLLQIGKVTSLSYYGIFLLSKDFSKYLRKKIVYLSCKHTIELPTIYILSRFFWISKKRIINNNKSFFICHFFFFVLKNS